MSVASGPYIATNGLVFAYDMGNPERSWEGAPTTNFYSNGQFAGGTGMPQESGSNPTNTVISSPNNPGNSGYVLEQSMGIAATEYQIDLTTQLLPSTTYVLSGWYAESPDYSCADGSRMFHCRAFSASGNNVALGTGIGTVITTTVINGITWKYCYATLTTPSDYNNLFNWYLGYGPSSYTGKRYYTNIQMELGSYPNRFVDGTRSNTQALLDLTGGRIITANSLTYASNNTFSFNGTTDFLTIPTISLGNGNLPWTVSAWVKTTTDATGLGQGSIMSNLSGGPVYSALCVNSGKIAYWTYQNSAWAQKLGVGTTVNNNAWHLLTWVNNSNSTMAMYVDGVLDSNVANSTSGNNNPIDTIGNSWNAKFAGSISSVQVYNVALTAEQVALNFNAYRGRYGV